MKIRKATLKDVPEIVEMWKAFMNEHDNKIVARKNRKLRPFAEKAKNAHLLFRKYVSGLIGSRNAMITVVEDGGKLWGYSIVKIKDNIPVFKIKKMGYFSDLYLKKKYRGRGIATKLKKKGIRWMKKKGVKMVSIEVSPANIRARKIYRKWGFEEFHIDMRKKL